MRIAICTIHTEECDYYAKYTSMNLRSYCNLHGYDFIESTVTLDPNRPHAWSKIILLQQFIDKYDWLVWIDTDAVVTNKDIYIEDIIDPNYDIIVSREDRFSNAISTGIFLVKCSKWSKDFLEKWYKQEQFVNNFLWENAAFIHLHNSDPYIQSHTKIVGQKVLNSYPSIFSQGDFIVHYIRHFGDRKPLTKMAYYGDYNHVHSRNEIPELLNKLGLFGYGIEIGVERGIYSEQILSKSNISRLYLCDPWYRMDNYNDINNTTDNVQEQKLKETIERVSRFGDRVEILRMLSQDASRYFYNDSLDFVYIDANHAYEYVLNDIKVWYPKVRTGGIVAGHDFLDGEILEGSFGVRQAVTEFFRYASCVYITTEDWPSWYVLKE